MKNQLLTLGVVLMSCVGFAQDIHFSQYNETPSLVNPALTGSAYVMRASINFKDQWSSVTVPYRTMGASFDMKLKASAWEKVDPFKSKTYKKAFNRLAAGLSFFNDQAGDGKMGMNQVNLSFATFIKTGDNSTLSLGLQGSVVQKSIDFSNFLFSNQYSGSGYDPTIANGEVYGSRSFIYPDFAGGVLWNYRKDESAFAENDQLYANAGVAIFHINTPHEKFLMSTKEQMDRKYVVHSNFLIGVPGSKIGIAPSFLFEFQGKQKELLGGVMMKYYLKEDSRYTGYIRKSSLGLGVYYRNKDAAIISMLLEMGQYALGVSYDLNTSGLNKVSKLSGGPEITIRYNSANPFLFQKK